MYLPNRDNNNRGPTDTYDMVKDLLRSITRRIQTAHPPIEVIINFDLIRSGYIRRYSPLVKGVFRLWLVE